MDDFKDGVNKEDKIEFPEEQEAFLKWAQFSVEYTLQINGDEPDEIQEKAKEIVFSLFRQATGNRDEDKELTSLDFELIFESIINWMGNNKDGFVPLSESMGWE